MLSHILVTTFSSIFFLFSISTVLASPIIHEAILEERAPHIYQDEVEIVDEPRGPDFSGDLPPMWPAYSWQHDLADPVNLVPVRNKMLYYTDSGSRGKCSPRHVVPMQDLAGRICGDRIYACHVTCPQDMEWLT